MEDDRFKIYVDRLGLGHAEKIEECFDPAFMDIREEDLAFCDPVHVRGQAVLEGDALVLTLAVETKAQMPCAVCNEKVDVIISIPNFCHTVDAESITSGIYNYKEVLREMILLEVPLTAECQLGKCPEREELAKFFSNERK